MLRPWTPAETRFSPALSTFELVRNVTWSGPGAPEYPRVRASWGPSIESETPNAFDEETQHFLEACSAVIRPLWNVFTDP
jgi:hypothetical protein